MKVRQLGGNNDTKIRMFIVVVLLFISGYVLVTLIKKMSKQGFTNLEHKPQDSMFLFANNKSKPSCCNFSYSSSNGCVCIDKEQQMLLHTRGGNRTIDADF
jgi:hypothetical protein